MLPFKPRGDDRGVEALAEGLTDEVVTGLSRFSYLRVISPSSTRRYSSELADVHASEGRFVLLHDAGRTEASMDHLKRAVGLFAEIGESPERDPGIWALAAW